MIPDLVKKIKGSSSKWINDNTFVKGRFRWQEGYGAFSCSHSELKKIIAYIENQEKHHRVIMFAEEYIDFLEQSGVIYNPKYLLKNV